MAQARIAIIGDSSSYQRSVKEAALVTDRLGLDMKKLSVTAKASSEAQVAASVRKTERLRSEVSAYRSIALAAEKGSKEQIAASNLAARSERNLAASLGVTAREARGLSVHGGNAERDLGRASRGALAGSGIFRGLGRSLAFASGGFLAFASGGQFIRSSIDAAREAGVTQKQMGAQFRASGLDIKNYQEVVDQTTSKLSALSGVNKDQLDRAFTTIFRSTKNVSTALKDTKIAADVASGSHKSIAVVALAIGKAAAGSTTSLRRLGIELPKGTTGLEAIAIAAERFKGQAAAGATVQARFTAVLHQSEVIIGLGLLPSINKLLTSGAKWLAQMNQSGRLQRDVAHGAHTIGEAFKALRALMQPIIAGFRLLSRLSGGTKHALELLGTAFLALELRARLIKWGLITTGIEATGAAAATATGEVAGLSGALARLGGLASGKYGAIGLLAPIAFALAQHGESTNKQAPGTKKFKGGYVDRKTGNWAIVTPDGVKHDTGVKAPGFADSQIFGPGKGGAGPIVRGIDSPSRFAPTPSTADPRRGISLQGQFNLADLRLAQAQLTPSTADDRRVLSAEAAIVRLQLQHTKTLKDRIQLTQQLAGIVGQIQGIDQADAQAAKAAAAAAKQRRQDALQASEFKILGLDPTGQPFAPALRTLRRELGNIRSKIKGTTTDTKKNEGILRDVTKLLFGKHAHELTKDVRNTVKQMLDAINQALGTGTGIETRFKAANTNKLLAGLGLSPDQIRATRARLSQLGPGGTVPQGSYAAAGGGDVVVHTTFKLDGRTVATNTTRHQDKQKRRNPPQKRGPHAK